VEAPQVRFADDAIYLLRLDFLMMQHVREDKWNARLIEIFLYDVRRENLHSIVIEIMAESGS
jgi:hypothetical protein